MSSSRARELHVFVVVAVLALVAVLGAPSAKAVSSAAAASRATAPTPTLVVDTPAPIVAFLPLWLAEWNGLYAKAGVDVQINLVPTPSALPTLASGRADVYFDGLQAPLFAQSSGYATSTIYASATNQSSWVIGTKGINTVADCTKFLTSGPGTPTDAWSHTLRDLFHANYTITYIPNPGSTGPPLLASGQADCAIGNTMFRTVSQGITHVVLNPLTGQGAPAGMPAAGPESGLWGLKQDLVAKRAAVVRFLKAFHQAVVLVKKMPAAQLANLAHSHPEFAPFSVDDLTADIATNQPLFEASGYISAADWNAALNIEKHVIQAVSTTDPQWSWDNLVDMSYLVAAVPSTKPPLHVNASIVVGSRSSLGHLASGPVVVTVSDRSRTDGFVLRGPGVTEQTQAAFVGKTTWQITLRSGVYVYGSLKHPKLRHRVRVK